MKALIAFAVACLLSGSAQTQVTTENLKTVNKIESIQIWEKAKEPISIEEYSKIIEIEKEKEIEEIKAQEPISSMLYSSYELKYHGVLYFNNYKWTWYSQRVLPGGGLKIPGRHVDENGYICDENNYICLASSELSKGTIIETPLGKNGKIYDSGCAFGVIDVYVDF